MKTYAIAVVALTYKNFAEHCLHEAKRMGYGEVKKKIVCGMARFYGSEMNLEFNWIKPDGMHHYSHNLSEYSAVHMAGPEVDQDMVDMFEMLRDKIKNAKVSIT